MSKFFSGFSTYIADLSGKPGTFVVAVTLVIGWAVFRPFFGYSETWQLMINGFRSPELTEPRWQGPADDA